MEIILAKLIADNFPVNAVWKTAKHLKLETRTTSDSLLYRMRLLHSSLSPKGCDFEMSWSADLQRSLQSGHCSRKPIQLHRQKSLGYGRKGLRLHLLRGMWKEMSAEDPDPGTAQAVQGDLWQLKSRFRFHNMRTMLNRARVRIFFTKKGKEAADFSNPIYFQEKI